MMNVIKTRIAPLLGIIALVAVIGFTVAACDTGNGPGGGPGPGPGPTPKSATYVVYGADEYKYELVISGTVTGNAPYEPKQGDSYKLTITKAGSQTKTSTGTVGKVDKHQWNVEIILRSGNKTFTVGVPVEGENGRAALTGDFWLAEGTEEIPVDGGETIEKPEFAYTPTEDGTGFILLKGTVNQNGSAVIPATFLGKPVKELGMAFTGNTNLTTVTFASGSQLKTIGQSTFEDCTSLTSITIPASVTEIAGWHAFRNCTNLTTVTFASGSQLKTIGGSAFRDCTSLTGITIPASVTEIAGWGTFENCTSLTTVTFAPGSQLKTIGSFAFKDCTSLTGITIPPSVTTIGLIGEWGGVFDGCTGITEITIPSTVKYVGPGAFSQWTSSQKIIIQGYPNLDSTFVDWEDGWHWTEANIEYTGTGQMAVVFSYIQHTSGNSYTLEWGIIFETTYAYVSSEFSSNGLSLTPAGTHAGYLTGSDATTVFNNIRYYYFVIFDNVGTYTGTFEQLVNMSQEGINAPEALKTALLENKNNVPIGSVFQTLIR